MPDEEIPEVYRLARGVSWQDYQTAKRHRIFYWSVVMGSLFGYIFTFLLLPPEYFHFLKHEVIILIVVGVGFLSARIFPKAFKMHTVQYQTYAKWRAIKKHMK